MREKKEKTFPLFAGLAEKMKQNKRFEIGVYAALIGIAVLLYVLTIGGDEHMGADASVISNESASASDIESRLERVLSEIKGAGAVKVMVTYGADASAEGESSNEIRGVLVVAEGAGDIAVRMNLCYAVEAVLGVEPEMIEIFEMG